MKAARRPPAVSPARSPPPRSPAAQAHRSPRAAPPPPRRRAAGRARRRRDAETEWSYSSVGKRDPFRSFVSERRRKDALDTRCATPLGRFELEQLNSSRS